MKIGIFRNHFDPPNYGHIFSVVYALKAFNLERILICPIYNHSLDKQLSSWDHRVSMVRLAFHGLDDCLIETMDETNKSGTCLNLLKNLKQTLPKASFIMFDGADIDKDLDEILKLCTIARVPQAESSNDPYAIPTYKNTRVKNLVKKGKWDDLAKMLPANIVDFIKTNKLYKEVNVVSNAR